MSEDQVRVFRDVFGIKSVYLDDYEKLRTRIAELEAANSQAHKELLWRDSCVIPDRDAHIELLEKRIAKLEAAQQWRDASDPPTEEGECEVIQHADMPARRYAFWRNGEWRNQHEQTLGGITHYKRAAPMPAMEAVE